MPGGRKRRTVADWRPVGKDADNGIPVNRRVEVPVAKTVHVVLPEDVITSIENFPPERVQCYIARSRRKLRRKPLYRDNPWKPDYGYELLPDWRLCTLDLDDEGYCLRVVGLQRSFDRDPKTGQFKDHVHLPDSPAVWRTAAVAKRKRGEWKKEQAAMDKELADLESKKTGRPVTPREVRERRERHEIGSSALNLKEMMEIFEKHTRPTDPVRPENSHYVLVTQRKEPQEGSLTATEIKAAIKKYGSLKAAWRALWKKDISYSTLHDNLPASVKRLIARNK
jgi:hypothetical protein